MRKITDEQITKAIALYEQGHSVGDVIRIVSLNCSEWTVKNYLKRRGVKMRGNVGGAKPPPAEYMINQGWCTLRTRTRRPSPFFGG